MAGYRIWQYVYMTYIIGFENSVEIEHKMLHFSSKKSNNQKETVEKSSQIQNLSVNNIFN
jgi:hypothetical protein